MLLILCIYLSEKNENYISKCKTNKSLATAKQPKSEPPHPQIYIAGQTLTARAAGMKDTQKGLLLASICSYHPLILCLSKHC